MANVIIFHHACGLTPGVSAFAARIEAAGHTVQSPDLYEGSRFETIEEGVANAEQIGLMAIADRGVAAAKATLDAGMAEGNPTVALGFSLGVLPAQKLAQTVPGVAAVVLLHGGVPASTFGDRWPDDVSLQLHLSPDDEWAEPDVVAALAADARGSELFWYSGSDHLVTDESRPEYDAQATEQILARILDLLQRL